MKHCFSAARDFQITILRPDKPEETLVQSFESSLDANIEAIRCGGEGAVIRIRPLIEETYFEGLDVYPRPLHRDAHDDARRGWTDAELMAQRLQSSRGCIVIHVPTPCPEASILV
jgi:hypothetical protein